MTVGELMKYLATMDPETKVLVSVNTYTSRHSLAEESPFCVDHAFGAATLHISLRQGLYIARNKRSAVSA